jgi:hypothetical protein
MQAAAFGHQIENLHEGLTVFHEGAGRFIPMQSTNIAIEITSGLATVRTQRVFRNNEDVAIEAVLRWCQTNASQSLFSSKVNLLSRAEVAPLGESGGAVKLKIGA